MVRSISISSSKRIRNLEYNKNCYSREAAICKTKRNEKKGVRNKGKKKCLFLNNIIIININILIVN